MDAPNATKKNLESYDFLFFLFSVVATKQAIGVRFRQIVLGLSLSCVFFLKKKRHLCGPTHAERHAKKTLFKAARQE